ncbi:ABC transporter permease [Georgenia subflava]|uniref:ABC transporter permease subunit n=1 Tax=Georgenia subflava TaxID=1622177 RepID=A0A6N7ECI0_9MICO|nr:ABC transporter permease [Georgenia subflava]MPV35680.1 ABC transporter permease subunit [Georgenia subflava]
MRYVLRRVGQAALVLWAAYTATFLLLYVLPGDAVDQLFDPTRISAATAGEKEQMRAYYGLDDPLVVQYLGRLAAALQGDLGLSIQTGRPVTEELARVLPATLVLSGFALALAVVLALVVAVSAVVTTSRRWRNALLALPPAAVSIPGFVIGLVLLQVFSFQLHWFPSIGDQGLTTLVLPGVALAITVSAPIAQLLAGNLLHEGDQPYATTAAAKGFGRIAVTLRELLRNATLPAFTMAGLVLGNLLAGAIIIETVFSRTGIGRLAETAVRTQDIPVVQGVVLLGAFIFVAVNLAVDLVYPLLDPRLRTGRPGTTRTAARVEAVRL